MIPFPFDFRGGGSATTEPPGGNGTATNEQPGSPPPFLEQLWNLAASVAEFVADDCRTISATEYAGRLKICEACPRRKESVCLECGCHLALKAQWRCMQCPLGKWPAVDQAEPVPPTAPPP